MLYFLSFSNIGIFKYLFSSSYIYCAVPTHVLNFAIDNDQIIFKTVEVLLLCLKMIHFLIYNLCVY